MYVVFIVPSVFDEPCEFPAFQFHETKVSEFPLVDPAFPKLKPSESKEVKLLAFVFSADVPSGYILLVAPLITSNI